MKQGVYDQILKLAAEDKERTVSYLTENLGPIVEPGEAVLICFQNRQPGSLSELMEQAVLRCGGVPVVWGEDRRWKALLRLAFTSRATTVIGTPCVILGLRKLKKAMVTPLYIRNVVTAGYPCTQWMKEGIISGFDCKIFSCLGLYTTGAVAGFSCDHGVHLREDAYEIKVLDEQSQPLPAGELGRWAMSPVGYPALSVVPGEFGRLDRTPCPCGKPGLRMVDRQHWDADDRELANLAEELLRWTSVLDFQLCRGSYGLELEMVVFPGEKLPKLPTCARQVIRPWNPEADEPFPDVPPRKNTLEYADYH